jgi:hypothetical protein
MILEKCDCVQKNYTARKIGQKIEGKESLRTDAIKNYKSCKKRTGSLDAAGERSMRRCFFRQVKQDCQMFFFINQFADSGKFWRALKWKMIVYFMTVWNI